MLRPLTDDNAAKFITARELVWQVATLERFEQAIQVLQECTGSASGHENCQPALKGVLPTRVIDCQDPSSPRLYVSSPGTCNYYVALSYVWGEDQPYKTTTANLSAYSRSIDCAVLPQTILDAIKCTRSLGLRFLWVDALCILQDSDEDKGRELVRMRNIYRNAYVTIIAATAPRASGGGASGALPWMARSRESTG